jgi:hypothetical protein
MRTLSLLTVTAIGSLTAALAFSGSACSPYDPSLGDEPYKCADTEPFCPTGYACMMQGSAGSFCINKDGTSGVDGGGGSDQLCSLDVNVEGPNRNDDYTHAFSTGVETAHPSIPYAGLAICPAGDKDTYQIVVQTMGSIDAVASVTGGALVQVNILGTTGMIIKPGTLDPANPLQYHANAANLPPGTYYAQAFSTSTATNAYKLTLAVTHP